MTIKNQTLTYSVLNNELLRQQIGITAAELHGLISGIICGGVRDESWLILLHDLTNEGLAFAIPLSEHVNQLYGETNVTLERGYFDFQLFMPVTEIVFECADALAGWVNHFLLGIGLAQPKFDKVKGDIHEVIDDLRNIAQLGYDDDEDQNALARDLEQLIEYVRVAAMMCYAEFVENVPNIPAPQEKTRLH